MNLLYIWNHSFYGEDDEKEYVLNSKYNIHFDETGMKLYIERNESYVDGFWGENIFDVIAVVGENGSGKTKLAYAIMDILNQMVTINSYVEEKQFIIVFEENMVINTYITAKFLGMKVETNEDIITSLPSMDYSKIDLFKFGYFTNALTYGDYIQEKYGVVFDGSLGGSFRKYFNHNYEMRFISTEANMILNYYEEEFDKVLDFLFSDLNNGSSQLVFPEWIDVSIKDYNTNLEYILSELEEMGKKRDEICTYCGDGQNCLKEICRNILNKGKNGEDSRLAVHLLLNLFKELCIPQTSDQKLEAKALKFLQIIEQSNSSLGNDGFETLQDIFDLLENDKNVFNAYDKDDIKKYRNIVSWVSDSGIFQNMIYMGKRRFIISRDKETIKELRKLYKETRFAFPYLFFEFGLSTGEFNFLKLFSKIASLVENKRSHVGCDQICKNIFLFLDEADLSLHPRWQQRYVSWILEFVTSYFSNCSVQILIATHSPIMLSDFPEDNVLYLWKDGNRGYADKRHVKTFGSNIHSLFMDAFFLEDSGTMGVFAEQKINEIASAIRCEVGPDVDKKLKVIDSIGDDIIRNKLLQMYDQNVYKGKKRYDELGNTAIDTTIYLLKNQIENLQSTVRELEKIKRDKN